MVQKSRHQGVVGEKGVFEGLKVLSYRSWESDYGTTHFYSLVDEVGNSFVYFASRDMGLEIGQLVSVRATVKKHEMHTPKFKKGEAPTYAQTVLTRCSLVVRARLVTSEAVEKYLGKTVVKNPEAVK